MRGHNYLISYAVIAVFVIVSLAGCSSDNLNERGASLLLLGSEFDRTKNKLTLRFRLHSNKNLLVFGRDLEGGDTEVFGKLLLLINGEWVEPLAVHQYTDATGFRDTNLKNDNVIRIKLNFNSVPIGNCKVVIDSGVESCVFTL